MIPEHDSFGQALRRLRHQRGRTSLRRFAESVNYSAAYVSEIERGIKPPTAEVARICDVTLEAGGLLVALAVRDTRATERVPPPEQPMNLLEVVMAAAHESTSHAALDGSRSMPEMSIDQARDSVRLLARDYNGAAPLDTLTEARKLRDAVRERAELTIKPRQTADLYQVAGQACGIMSIASFDLAIFPAAVEQARAAMVYADLVDDQSLQAWSLGTIALISTWLGRPREAVEHVLRGLTISPAGTARLRLQAIAARAWSHLGNPEKTRTAVEAAEAERQTVGTQGADALHDEIGGEFAFGPSRTAMCVASAWLQLDDATQAAASARHAIQMRARDQSGALIDEKASTDLAVAELLRDDLDAAAAALDHVWGVPKEFRNHGLVSRLSTVAEHLQTDRYGDVRLARDLAERIEAYSSASAPRALPPASDPFA